VHVSPRSPVHAVWFVPDVLQACSLMAHGQRQKSSGAGTSSAARKEASMWSSWLGLWPNCGLRALLPPGLQADYINVGTKTQCTAAFDGQLS